MLKGIIINTMSMVLAAIILVATSGFNVFKHSCHTEKTTEFSLIIPEFECDHNDQVYEANLPQCCPLSETTEEGETCTESKCCDTENYLVKLNITLDLQDYSNKIFQEFESIPTGQEANFTTPSKELKQIIISNDLPPPLSGKSLHIFLHQLNIHYPSV